MKILIDEMPNKPSECKYSAYNRNGRGDAWYGCSLGTHTCSLPDCPHFVALSACKNEMIDVYSAEIKPKVEAEFSLAQTSVVLLALSYFMMNDNVNEKDVQIAKDILNVLTESIEKYFADSMYIKVLQVYEEEKQRNTDTNRM